MSTAAVASSTGAGSTFQQQRARDEARRVLGNTEELLWACEERGETPAAVRLYYTRALHGLPTAHPSPHHRQPIHASPHVKGRNGKGKARVFVTSPESEVGGGHGGFGRRAGVLSDAVVGDVLPARFKVGYVCGRAGVVARGVTGEGKEGGRRREGERVKGRDGSRSEGVDDVGGGRVEVDWKGGAGVGSHNPEGAKTLGMDVDAEEINITKEPAAPVRRRRGTFSDEEDQDSLNVHEDWEEQDQEGGVSLSATARSDGSGNSSGPRRSPGVDKRASTSGSATKRRRR